jgi:hypothetical protein
MLFSPLGSAVRRRLLWYRPARCIDLIHIVTQRFCAGFTLEVSVFALLPFMRQKLKPSAREFEFLDICLRILRAVFCYGYMRSAAVRIKIQS